MTEPVGRAVGQKIRKVLAVDKPRGEATWGRYLHVRVVLDVGKPLCRGMPVSIGGDRDIILCRYKKLSDFCYVCGKLDHVESDCTIGINLKEEGKEIPRLYGPWLRADGQEISTKETVENLFVTTKAFGSENDPHARLGTMEGGSESARVEQVLAIDQSEGDKQHAQGEEGGCRTVEVEGRCTVAWNSSPAASATMAEGEFNRRRDDRGDRSGGKAKCFWGRPKGSGNKISKTDECVIVPVYSGGRKRDLEACEDDMAVSRKRVTPMEVDISFIAAETGTDQSRRSS